MNKYRKDVRDVVRFAEDKGFVACKGMTGSGHWKLLHPAGGMLILPATPHRGGRWVKNVHADIRRILKEKP